MTATRRSVGKQQEQSIEGAMKVLFVEDDEGMAKAVRDALRGKGYTCNIAGLGQQAVELAKSRPYDIIVLLSD